MSRLIAVVIVAAVLLTGCVQETVSAKGTPGTAVKPLGTSVLPPTMLGLAVKEEDVKEALAESKSSYVTALSLYSLRKGKLLQATLQVSKVDQETVDTVPDFETAVAQSIGGTVPRIAKIGDDRVFVTRGNRQRLSVWFRGSYMFVLATRDDYPQPRSLLRTALGIDPEAAA